MNNPHMARPLARAAFGGITAELWPRAPYAVRDAGGAGVIGFAFEAQAGEDAIATDRVRPFRRGANTLAWLPPGCGVYSASRTGGEYLVLRGFAMDAVPHADAANRPVRELVSTAAVGAAHALRRSLLGGQPESSVLTAAMNVLRTSLLAHMTAGRNPAAAWLTPARLAKVDQVIAAQVGGRLGVGDLSAALGLSAGFLTLAFQAGLGTTPHRYIRERRLAAARDRLVGGTEAIATVAAECGFADQAHLTRTMRTLLGVTPAVYRSMGADTR